MLLSFLLAAAAPVAAEPAALAPAGRWSVEYADTMCVLSRDYGAGPDKVKLVLRPLPMGNENRVARITPGGGGVTRRGRVEIVLLPAGRPATGTYDRFPLSDKTMRIAMMYFDGAALDGLDKATEIDISLDGETRRLALPGIGGATTALAACQADLLKSWGVDPAERAAIGTLAKGDFNFLGPNLYPSAAINAHAEGTAISVVSVGATGKVEQCKIAVSSGNKALDEATCQTLRTGGRFVAARDKEGHPMASHLVVPMRWTLPES